MWPDWRKWALSFFWADHLCFLLEVGDVSSQLLPRPCLLLFVFHVVMDSYPSGITSPSKLFLLWVDFFMVFYYSHRKAINTIDGCLLMWSFSIGIFSVRNIDSSPLSIWIWFLSCPFEVTEEHNGCCLVTNGQPWKHTHTSNSVQTEQVGFYIFRKIYINKLHIYNTYKYTYAYTYVWNNN